MDARGPGPQRARQARPGSIEGVAALLGAPASLPLVPGASPTVMSHVRPWVLCALLVSALAALGSQPARAEDPAPAAPAAPASVSIPWVRNWAEAQAQAKKEGKDLLIDFTGSDWCIWCKRLEEEVFHHEEFLKDATKSFVFVYLDFPNGEEPKKAVVDEKLNQKLMEAYSVRGFPTIVLANHEGMPYAKTGYQEGGPAAYLTHLADLRGQGDKVKGMLAKGKTDFAVFKAGFDALSEANLLGYGDYAWVLDHAEKQDADGSKGLKAGVEAERARQRSMVEQRELMALVKDAKGPSEIPWEKIKDFLLASKHLSGELLFQASLSTGDWALNEKKDPALAKKLYALPLRDPEIAGNERAKGLIDEKIKACDAPAEAAPEAPMDQPPK